MRDPQKWRIAVARFNAYSNNIPSFPKTEDVKDYHALVAALEEASGEDLSSFKIPPEKLKPKLMSVRPAPYGGGRGSANYSDIDYCDSNFFEAQIEALKNYLPTIDINQLTTPYDHLSDSQLQELMRERNIKPPRPKDGCPPKMPSRVYIIAALLKDDAPRPTHHPVSNVYNFHDSNVNFGSPGASITANVGITREEFGTILDDLRQLLEDTQIDQPTKQEININIGTIELQLSSGKPNVSILKESLKSIQAILENAAGSLLAAAISPNIQNILSRLG